MVFWSLAAICGLPQQTVWTVQIGNQQKVHVLGAEAGVILSTVKRGGRAEGKTSWENDTQEKEAERS